MKTPTMIYAPIDDKLIEAGVTTQTKDYIYKVIDASEAGNCSGWYGSPALIPKKADEKSDKDNLQIRADVFNVDLDMRRGISKLTAQVEALEAK